MFERVFLILTGYLLILISLAVIYAWKTHNYDFISLYSRSYPIQFNTALLFGLLGIGTIASAYKKWIFAYLSGTLIILYSILVLIQFILKIDFGLDWVFNTPFFVQIHSFTGKMSPNTAMTLILCGLSLFFLPSIKKFKWNPIVIATFGLSIFSFAIIPIISFFGEIDAAYGWSPIIRMSLISSVSLSLFGIAITIYSWKTSRLINDASMHRWFSIPYSLSIFLITIFLSQAILYDQQKRRLDSERAESNFIASQLKTSIETRLLGLERMANRWKVRGGVPYNEFKSDAELYIQQQLDLNMIGIVESGKLKWRFDDPNHVLKEGDLLNAVISKDSPFFQLPPYIVIKAPLDKDQYLVAILNAPDLIQDIIKDDQRHFLISIKKDENVLYQSKGFPNKDFILQARVSFKDLNWSISSYSTELTYRRNNLSLLSLLAGGILSLLVGIAIFSAHSLRLRSKELNEAHKTIIEQDRLASLGSLTAGIAHEIKNPLNFINNFSDLAKEQLDEFKTSKDTALLDLIEKNIKAIHKQGDKANNIITKMLAHSRLKSSDATQTNIHSLIEEDLSLALHSFKMKNPLFQIFVKKDFDEKIPIISLSREDFSRTLLNLINNALYALVSKKGQNPTLSIKTEATKNGVIIKIRDNGVGISKEVQEKLYVPFFTTKPTGIGTGLGLSLARAYIVDELGGKIECKSKEGEFTEFTLFIPIRTEMARLHRSDEA